MSESNLVPVQFASQYAAHDSAPLTAEIAENLYLEAAPSGAKSPTILLGTPGLLAFSRLPTSPVRGMVFMRSSLYVAAGGRAYLVGSDGSYTELGYIDGAGKVMTAHNGEHAWFATSRSLYAVNQDGVVGVTVPSGGRFNGVTGQDGYLLGTEANSNSLYVAGPDDALTINALDFTTVDSSPDLNVGLIQDHREPFVFKAETTEVFANNGNADYPFIRTTAIERGCASGGSIAKNDHGVFFLGDDFQVYMMKGYQPRAISTHVISEILRADSGASQAEAFTYTQRGHAHYVLSTANITLVYDITTGLWHRRRSNGLGRWRASGHAYARPWKKHLVGDYDKGVVYELSESTYDEDGHTLRRRGVSVPLWLNGARGIMDELSLDIETGVAVTYSYDAWASGTAYALGDRVTNNSNIYQCEAAGTSAGSGGPTSESDAITDNTVTWRFLRPTAQGQSPQAILDWTDDGGRTYSNELLRSFGATGEYVMRVRWNNLGAFRNRSMRVTITDPVPVRILGMYHRSESLAV